MTIFRPAAALAAFAVPAALSAHTVWLAPEAGGWHMLFGGHAGKLEPYDAAKLRQVRAFSATGSALKVMRRTKADGIHIAVAGKPALLTAHFDNGIHTRRADGPSVEKPMNQVPRAISATNAVKYHKTIVQWGAPIVARSVGQPFELVPLSSDAPVAGLPMRLRVLIGGTPAAGIKVARDEEGGSIVSDRQGIATYVPVRGFNKVWAGRRTPVKGNPAFTESSIEYSLGFTAG